MSDDQCKDVTKTPRGYLRCTLPAGHDLDPLSMHIVDFDQEVLDDCACGNRSIATMDHSKFCCVTVGFFTEEDWANIAKAADKHE